MPPPPIYVSVVVSFNGINVTVLTTPSVAVQLRKAFACAAGVTLSQVLMNSTTDGTSEVITYLPTTTGVNALTLSALSCGDSPSRRLEELLNYLRTEYHAAPEVSVRADRALAFSSGSVSVTMLVVVTPPPQPSSAPSVSIAQQEFNAAQALVSQFAATIAYFTANATNGTNPLVQALQGFGAAVGAILNVSSSAVIGNMAVAAPVILASPPNGYTSSGLSGAQIVGVVVGVVSGVLLLVAIVAVVLRRSRAKAAANAKAGSTAAPATSDNVV